MPCTRQRRLPFASPSVVLAEMPVPRLLKKHNDAVIIISTAKTRFPRRSPFHTFSHTGRNTRPLQSGSVGVLTRQVFDTRAAPPPALTVETRDAHPYANPRPEPAVGNVSTVRTCLVCVGSTLRRAAQQVLLLRMGRRWKAGHLHSGP